MYRLLQERLSAIINEQVIAIIANVPIPTPNQKFKHQTFENLDQFDNPKHLNGLMDFLGFFRY